jgi:hypothetical protein
LKRKQQQDKVSSRCNVAFSQPCHYIDRFGDFSMSRSYYIFALVYLLVLLIETAESRSINHDTIQSILEDPFDDTHRKLLHAFTGYRHRFEQSPAFKTLRWALKDVEVTGLCELCDLGVPLVSRKMLLSLKNGFFD